jgi:cytochrome P450
MICVSVHNIHRRAELFPSPDDFIPERFLSTADLLKNSPKTPKTNQNLSTIPKDAFRPFEKGPRSCIGQESAMLEMRTVLVLTVRRFEI